MINAMIPMKIYIAISFSYTHYIKANEQIPALAGKEDSIRNDIFILEIVCYIGACS
ncbi:hypothetical protein J31TS3_01200 [Paenibacillus lactis]|nr:hypothetical protein J31TS3_01200 [Paenibacillus lactis]